MEELILAHPTNCQHCNTWIRFGKGEPVTKSDPGTADVFYCPECGAEYDVRWDLQGHAWPKFYWGLNLDESHEDLWAELERVQDGYAAHHIAVIGETREHAAKALAYRLVHFFMSKMYISTEYGINLEE